MSLFKVSLTIDSDNLQFKFASYCQHMICRLIKSVNTMILIYQKRKIGLVGHSNQLQCSYHFFTAVCKTKIALRFTMIPKNDGHEDQFLKNQLMKKKKKVISTEKAQLLRNSLHGVYAHIQSPCFPLVSLILQFLLLLPL